jgi:ankyrin repeat protein
MTSVEPAAPPPLDALKPVGFWSGGDPPVEGLPDPRTLVDATWPMRERARVAAYLRAGNVVATYRGFSQCRFSCSIPWNYMGASDLSDGTWVWPEGFAHYLEVHDVKPPAEFLSDIAPRLPRLPPWWRLTWWVRRRRARARIAEGKREAALEAKRPPESTPLVLASERGDVGTVEKLLAEGADANQRLRSGDTALHRAARLGYGDVVKALLAHGAEVDAKDDGGATPLVDARSAWVTEMLLDAGAAVEPEPAPYMTPLGRALAWGDDDCARLLLARGADVNRTDNCGRVPLDLVRDVAGARALLDRGADARRGTTLITAVRSGDIELVRLMLDRGASLHARDGRGQSALFHAATLETGDALVELLLGLGADPRPANDMGDTALHQACARSSLASVERLLAAGAPVDTVSQNKMTPLHWAAFGNEPRPGRAAVLSRLLAAGAGPIDARDAWGRTPLLMAVCAGDAEAAEVLLDAGADPDLAAEMAGSARSVAEARRMSEIVRRMGAP